MKGNGQDSSKIKRLVKFGSVELICREPEVIDLLPSTVSFEIGARNLFNHQTQTYLEILTRSSLEVKFDLGEVTVDEETVRLIGSIPTICKLGQFPPQQLDLAYLQKYQEMVDTWAVDCELNSKYFAKMRATSPPLMCALCAPSLDDDSMAIFVLFVFTFFTLDDTFDNVTDFWKEVLPVADVKMAVDTFIQILNKKEAKVKNCTFPLFSPMCKMLRLLCSKLDLFESSSITEWLASVTAIFEAWGWETRTLLTNSEVTDSNVQTLRKYYMEIRDSTAGMHICTELISIFKNITISKKIRRDPLFQLTLNWMSRCVTLENDIFSFKKEMECGEKANIIWIKGQTQSMTQALEKVVRQTAAYVSDITILQNRLLQKFRQEGDSLQKYFTTCNLFIDSGIQFYLLSQRYGKSDFSVKIIIDE